MYNFDPEKLRELELRVAEQFERATPFRHFVVDDDVISVINDEYRDVAGSRGEWQILSTKLQ